MDTGENIYEILSICPLCCVLFMHMYLSLSLVSLNRFQRLHRRNFSNFLSRMDQLKHPQDTSAIFDVKIDHLPHNKPFELRLPRESSQCEL